MAISPASIGISEPTLLIHKHVTLHGSWVTSLRHMEELLEHLVRWDLHLERIVTDRFPLDQADEAYRVADSLLPILRAGDRRPVPRSSDLQPAVAG